MTDPGTTSVPGDRIVQILSEHLANALAQAARMQAIVEIQQERIAVLEQQKAPAAQAATDR